MRSGIRSQTFRIVFLFSFLFFLGGTSSSLVIAQTKDSSHIQQVQPFEVKAIPVALADPASNGEIIKDHFRFSWPSYIVPVMVTGYGIAAYYPKVVVIDRYQAYDYFWKNYHDFHTTADNYLQFAPAAATFSLSLCGVKGKHSLGEQIILYAGSMLVSEGIATGLKYTTKILRPDNSAYNSFPSGHTTSAFTGAEMMNQEYKGSSFLYSVFGYGTATATGVLRMMNNRHWLSDVMVGAGIGMISTKLVYAVYPVLKRKYLQRKARRTFSPGS